MDISYISAIHCTCWSLQNELDLDLGEIEEYISFSEVEDKDEDEHEDNQQIIRTMRDCLDIITT